MTVLCVAEVVAVSNASSSSLAWSLLDCCELVRFMEYRINTLTYAHLSAHLSKEAFESRGCQHSKSEANCDQLGKTEGNTDSVQSVMQAADM